MEGKKEKSLIEKFNQIVNNVINGKTDQIEISNKEYMDIADMLREFKFLYCYPNDNQFFNKDIIDNAVKHNKFIINRYFPNTDAYNQLLKDEELKNELEKNGMYVERIFKNSKNKNTILEDDAAGLNRLEDPFWLYIQNYKGIINQFKFYKPNKNLLIEGLIDDYLKIRVPMSISGQEKEDLINSKYLISKEDNIYQFSLNAPQFKYFWLQKLFIEDQKNRKIPKFPFLRYQKMMSQKRLEYIEVGDELIYKQCYKEGYSDVVKDLQKNQLKMFVIDENGKEVDVNSLDSADIIHDIRTAIAHCRVQEYVLSNWKFFGKIYYVIKEKKLPDNTKVKIKQAIFVMSEYLKNYAEGNYFNNADKKVFHFMYFPNVKTQISTPEQAVEFQNNCKIVKIALKEETDTTYFEEIVEKLFENYNNNESDEELDAFLANNLNQLFKVEQITIEDIGNDKHLDFKFARNSAFYNLPFNKTHLTQQSFVKDILTNYYDAEQLTFKWQKTKKEEKKLQIKPFGVGLILDNIQDLVACHRDKQSLDKYSYFQAYKSEVYYVLCMVVAYNNLVRNGFIENFEYKNFKVKIDKPETYERKLKSENMNEFRFYGLTKKHKGEGNIPNSTDNDKIDVIRWIRNGICHSGVFVRFDGSNNYEDNFFYFVNNNEDKEKQIEGQRKPDNIVRVRCKDLMEFAMRPLFAMYGEENSKENQTLSGETFSIIVEKCVEELKKYSL